MLKPTSILGIPLHPGIILSFWVGYVYLKKTKPSTLTKKLAIGWTYQLKSCAWTCHLGDQLQEPICRDRCKGYFTYNLPRLLPTFSSHTLGLEVWVWTTPPLSRPFQFFMSCSGSQFLLTFGYDWKTIGISLTILPAVPPSSHTLTPFRGSGLKQI